MAQAAKITSVGQQSTLTQSRAVQGAQVVATDAYPYVQPLDAGTGVMLGNAEFTNEQARRELAFAQYDNRGERRSVPQSWSLVRTTSETFARILESLANGVEGTGGTSTGGPVRRFQDVIARAIATYENNAKIIHGELALVGGAISIRI